MQTFKQMIFDLVVNEGVLDIHDVTLTQMRELTAQYIDECSDAEKWEFITEPQDNIDLPPLLIEVLMGRGNEPRGLEPPEIRLGQTMMQGAIQWCKPHIVEAIQNTVDNCYEDETIRPQFEEEMPF